MPNIILRTLRLAAATAFATAGIAAPAGAATVSISGSTLTYSASSGELNEVAVEPQADGRLLISDGGARVTPGSGCKPVSGAIDRALCAPAGVAAIEIFLRDLDDFAADKSALPTWIYGGDGHDELLGGVGADRLHGEAGDDTVHGQAGGDHLFGGSGFDKAFGDIGDDVVRGGPDHDFAFGGLGADRLFGEDGSDRLYGNHGGGVYEDGRARLDDGGDYFSGGAGTDSVIYQHPTGVRVSIDGVANDGVPSWAENDNVDTNVETLHGTHFDDVLIGSDAANRLSGRDGADLLIGLGGNDLVDGGPGVDDLRGGDGDDVLTAREPFGPEADTAVDCGGGNDSATRDGADPSPIACETWG